MCFLSVTSFICCSCMSCLSQKVGTDCYLGARSHLPLLPRSKWATRLPSEHRRVNIFWLTWACGNNAVLTREGKWPLVTSRAVFRVPEVFLSEPLCSWRMTESVEYALDRAAIGHQQFLRDVIFPKHSGDQSALGFLHQLSRVGSRSGPQCQLSGSGSLICPHTQSDFF